MTKNIWTSSDAVKATNGTCDTSWVASSVSIDSRKIKEGALFIAIRGENFDGHNFVLDAIRQGASAAIVEYIPDGADKNLPLLVVEDTYKALVDLARYSRNRIAGKIVAVTGSVGKTTTKEMIKTSLANQGNVYATEGNLNNHYGLPLSLTRMPKGTDYGVFELGMSAAGEISYLTDILEPDVAMITTIEAVHLENFNSIEDIAKAKSEIFEGVRRNGVAILNCDGKFFEFFNDVVARHNIKNTITFGKSENADFRLLSYKENDTKSSLSTKIYNKDVVYNLDAKGEHQAINSLGALAATSAMGVKPDLCVEDLSGYKAVAGRGKMYKLRLPDSKGKFYLIDDSYNASPASVKAALKAMSSYKGRKIAVLGDMLELGKDSTKFHQSLLNDLLENKIDKVFTAGSAMNELYNILPKNIRGEHRNNSKELISVINSYVKDGDKILVKGSRDMHMDNIVSSCI